MPEHYLGIDVGFSESRRTTGLCLLTIDQTSLQWRCYNTGTEESERWEALQSLVPESTSVDGVGIDGPLARDIKVADHYRSADALLSRGRFQRRGKPGPTNSPTGRDLHAHATKLAMLVLSLQSEGYLELQDADHPDSIHEARILEVFPTSFLAVLLPFEHVPTKVKRGERSDKLWETAVREHCMQRLVERLAPDRSLKESLESIKDHDHRAAFICALAALCVARKQYVAVGDPDDGHILLPPSEFWAPELSTDDRPWAEVTLRENINTVRKAGGHFAKAQILGNGMPWD